MFKNKSISCLAVDSFILSIIVSIVFSPLFGKLYIYIYNPISTGGLGGFDNELLLIIIQNSIIAFIFFLPLFIQIFVPKKQLITWLIFIFVPFIIFFDNRIKDLFWFFVLTVLGSLIGWLINFAIEKIKKISLNP